MREVFGAYDIVTKIEAASVDIIKDIATQIRGLDRIRSTITLLSSEKENQYQSENDHAVFEYKS